MRHIDWGRCGLVALMILNIVGVPLMMTACHAPVTASAPTDSLCVATGELHFSEPVLAAMNRADLKTFTHFNETWDSRCKVKP